MLEFQFWFFWVGQNPRVVLSKDFNHEPGLLASWVNRSPLHKYHIDSLAHDLVYLISHGQHYFGCWYKITYPSILNIIFNKV